MSEEELELHNRANVGDAPSTWALSEIIRLVEKANEATHECWLLRERITKLAPQLGSLSVTDPVVVTT